mmetsp:Transcript_21636/g.67541  ORF Transcript_21636/g.67541 Transcript_21636/m.67541 type:complete len:328 (+) Transcript_21636:55-1038(+)
MAAGLNKLVDSLVKQGSQKEGTVLPHWIQEGARLSYVSERSGQALDVEVAGISHSKQQVRFVFASDRKAWKCVSFSQIIAGNNPLRRRESQEKCPVAPAAESDAKDEAEQALDALEAKWSSHADARERKKRSRAPTAGPTAKATPGAWERPELLDVDSSPERTAPPAVEDLDAEEPTAAPTEPEDPDPYGLGEQRGGAEVPRSGDAGTGGAEAERSRGAGASREPRRRAGSGDRVGRKGAKVACGREGESRHGRRRRSPSRHRDPSRSGGGRRQRSPRKRRRRERSGSSGGSSSAAAGRGRGPPRTGGEGPRSGRRRTRRGGSSPSP